MMTIGIGEPADLGADKQGKSTAMAADAPTQVIATAGGIGCLRIRNVIFRSICQG